MTYFISEKRESLPATPTSLRRMVNSFASDDEPLYDSVASDEDYSSVDNLSLQNMKNEEKSGSAPDLRMPATEVRKVHCIRIWKAFFDSPFD